ncbi:MAG TPA: PPC domain-containing DNA-binding protein [Candidatus Limnocylindria bacterium]|nr:PPC domain-containing DNA-binding protein [Candidatus Limnocylindria bacterium]
MEKVVTGSVGKVHAFRLEVGEPFLESLQKVCEEHNIKNGVILSCMGSLDGARFFAPAEIPGKKFPYGYGEPTVLTGPIELYGATGFFSHGENNEVLLHVHVSLGDSEGKGYVGHLINGNKALFTIDVVLLEIEGINMGRRYHEDLGVYLFAPGAKE